MSSTEPSTESSAEIPAQYNPQAAEARWYDFPPPNVTGSLHMGHALHA
jgi:valyl-tRNA synthetase